MSEHARRLCETTPEQAAPEKVPASAPPTLSGMLRYARLLAQVCSRLVADQLVDELIDRALDYLFGTTMPPGLPDSEKATIGKGLRYALDEFRYGAPRRWVQRRLDRLAQRN